MTDKMKKELLNAENCWLMKTLDLFLIFEKKINQFTQKIDEPKKIWASYPAQLRTGQNAHNC